jgi:hypothetical protein
MPATAPELRYGLNVYKGAIVKMSSTLYVNSIIMMLEGQLSGVDNLIIGKGGNVTLRFVPSDHDFYDLF